VILRQIMHIFDLARIQRYQDDTQFGLQFYSDPSIHSAFSGALRLTDIFGNSLCPPCTRWFSIIFSRKSRL